MLDTLPLDLQAQILQYVGERPETVHRVCKSTWRLVDDTRALLLWLQTTFGLESAVFTATSLVCFSRWGEARVLQALTQLLDSGCYLDGTAASQTPQLPLAGPAAWLAGCSKG
ncbi:hypothetical protein HaLaN_32198, partial [Haematococcus lacustris]